MGCKIVRFDTELPPNVVDVREVDTHLAFDCLKEAFELWMKSMDSIGTVAIYSNNGIGLVAIGAAAFGILPFNLEEANLPQPA